MFYEVSLTYAKKITSRLYADSLPRDIKQTD